MDVLTEKGQQTLADEQEMAKTWENETGWKYVHTPKQMPAHVDAILLNRNGELAGVAETKCRDANLTIMETAFNNEWLITFDKLQKAAAVAEGLSVPLYCFLYLTIDKKILVIKAADEYGQIRVPLRIDWTETQATCNGGQVERLNAYMSLHHARIFQTKSLTEDGEGG